MGWELRLHGDGEEDQLAMAFFILQITYSSRPCVILRGVCGDFGCIVGVSPSWSAFAKSAGTFGGPESGSHSSGRLVLAVRRAADALLLTGSQLVTGFAPGPVHLPERSKASHSACMLHALYISVHPSISIHPVLIPNAVLCIQSHQKGGTWRGYHRDKPITTIHISPLNLYP